MYKDKNANSFDIIKNLEENDLKALNGKFLEAGIINKYDFISVVLLDNLNNVAKKFQTNLSIGRRFSIDETHWEEFNTNVLKFCENNENVSKFNLYFYSEFEGSCTLSRRLHYVLKDENIDSLEKEMNNLKEVLSSLNPNFSGATPKIK